MPKPNGDNANAHTHTLHISRTCMSCACLQVCTECRTRDGAVHVLCCTHTICKRCLQMHSMRTHILRAPSSYVTCTRCVCSCVCARQSLRCENTSVYKPVRQLYANIRTCHRRLSAAHPSLQSASCIVSLIAVQVMSVYAHTHATSHTHRVQVISGSLIIYLRLQTRC